MSYSKDWCKGFCRTCGTGCAQHEEAQYQLRSELAQVRAELLGYYRMAESGVWIKTKEYSGEIKERDSLREKLAVAVEALKKLMNGPGNRMVGWRLTWAHTFSKEALAKIQEPKHKPAERKG
jgi:hypothetical protein